MTTYASPRLTRTALVVIISLLFLAGCYMFAIGIFHIINVISESGRTAEVALKTAPSSTSPMASVNNLPAEVIDDQPRFPSTAAPSVELIFGGLTLGHAIFGIVSVTQERANFLATYSHLLLISCFVKLLFLVGK